MVIEKLPDCCQPDARDELVREIANALSAGAGHFSDCVPGTPCRACRERADELVRGWSVTKKEPRYYVHPDYPGWIADRTLPKADCLVVSVAGRPGRILTPEQLCALLNREDGQ